MRTEIDRQWCRALAEEIGDQPDLIHKITANYNRQPKPCADGSLTHDFKGQSSCPSCGMVGLDLPEPQYTADNPPPWINRYRSGRPVARLCDYREDRLMALPYEDAVRKWAAGKLGVSAEQIASVSIESDSGWGGTDVTIGDPPTCAVVARFVDGAKHEVIDLIGGEMYERRSWNFVDLLSEILDAGGGDNAAE